MFAKFFMRRSFLHKFAAVAGLVFAVRGVGLTTAEEPESATALQKRQYTLSFDQQQASDLEAKLIEAFNHGQCAALPSLISSTLYEVLPPIGLAIVAYCDPDTDDAERLFGRAEFTAPSSDVVVMLHARRVSQTNPAAAEPLWRRVLLLARSSYVRLMANAFLDGRGDLSEPIEVQTPLLFFASLRFFGGTDTNPQLQLLGGETSPSGFAGLQLSAGALHSMAFGAVAANYALNRTQYFVRPSCNLWKHDLELPLILRAGTNEDIRIIPFGEMQYLGEQPYYQYGGMRVAGIAFRGTYKQTVQASLYQDGYDNSLLNHQAGGHFRFNYLWEFYPHDWYVNFNAYIEHVEAKRDTGPRGGPTYIIPYSHNDIGLTAQAEHNFGRFLLGLNAGLILREDDLDSTYTVGQGGAPTVKRRQDLSFYLQPTLTVQLASSVQLLAIYSLYRNLSNMGPFDYQDQSYVDDVVSVGIRIYMESL